MLIIQASKSLEAISEMSEQDADASEMDEAEEVLGVPVVSDDESAVVVEPGKQALDLPAPPVASKRTPVLGLPLSVREVRRDEFDPALREKAFVQGVAVVGLVADQPMDCAGHESVVESLFDELRLVRRSTCDANGDWKTERVCDRHDLGSLAPLRLSDGSAPFLAPLKEPSMNASERSIPPRS